MSEHGDRHIIGSAGGDGRTNESLGGAKTLVVGPGDSSRYFCLGEDLDAVRSQDQLVAGPEDGVVDVRCALVRNPERSGNCVAARVAP